MHCLSILARKLPYAVVKFDRLEMSLQLMTTLKEEVSNHTSLQPFSKDIEHIHLL
jgi:hypothetical protein